MTVASLSLPISALLVPLSFSFCFLVFGDGLWWCRGRAVGRGWFVCLLSSGMTAGWTAKVQSLLPSDGRLRGQQRIGRAWLGAAVLSSLSEAGNQRFLSQGRWFGFLPHCSDFTVIQT